ncbi:hypothetical protein HPB51_019298 [Rhipicephalus microplus]|uniref:Uncharacterized protein n=1 Tax=Rhipicephalus microplus TaxID=6941 RepID=A0A9J6EUH2_RHIMP|nr:hypothetical protein HPB51_019298 [Rhipicephalus microplus]
MQRFSRPRCQVTVCEVLMDEAQQHDAGWEEEIGVVLSTPERYERPLEAAEGNVKRRLDEQQQQQGSSGGVAGRGAVAARGADTDCAASAVDVRSCSLAAAAAAPLPPARGGRWRRGSSTGSVLAEPFAWPLHGPLGGGAGSPRSAAMSRLSVRALRVLTPASALASLVANAIALCSNSWLHSTELMPNPSYNGSGDREQLAKNTVSGLWKICFNERELSHFSSSPSVSLLLPRIASSPELVPTRG